MKWEKSAEEKFKQLISKLPFFHRHIAEEVVEKKAGELAIKRGCQQIEKQDLTQAFRSEVPEVFKSYLDQLLKDADLG
jgi:hypothetical protein